MDVPFKKKGNSKDAWLDWLSDDGPSTDAQAELRERFKQQANTYQPRQYAPPTPASQPNPTLGPQPAAPVQPARPLQAAQAQPQAVSPPAAPPRATTAPTAANPAGVSIQINIPQLSFKRPRKWLATAKVWITSVKAWYLGQFAHNKRRTIIASSLVAVVAAGLLAGPFLHIGAKSGSGSAAAGSGGAATGYKKPPFKVVVPSAKPKLATADGVHAAYDGTKNVYSYSDSIGSNGFIVSEQPIPDKYNTAEDAINTIGPQIYGATNGHTVSTFAGDAYVTNSTKGAQAVVFSVRNLLMFIQSSHKFNDTEVQDYINSMQ